MKPNQVEATLLDTARKAYEAFRDSGGFWISSDFDGMPDKIKLAWCASVQAAWNEYYDKDGRGKE